MKPVSHLYLRRLRQLVTLAAVVMAMLATTVTVADAQVDRSRARPVPVQDVETLRLSCNPDSIDGQRGVLCRWSEATNPNTRAYQLFRITDGSPRQLVTTVGVDGRLGFFDTDVSAPSSLVYGVVSVNRAGRLLGRSAPVHVQFGQDIGQLRLACQPASVEGQRGVACRWSEASQSGVRGYLLYRSTDGGARQLIAEIPVDGRNGHFDIHVRPGGSYLYGVTAVDGSVQSLPKAVQVE